MQISEIPKIPTIRYCSVTINIILAGQLTEVGLPNTKYGLNFKTTLHNEVAILIIIIILGF